MASEVNPGAEEKGRKRGAIGANSFSGGKMILALLTEVVALHMRLTIVEVRKSGFSYLS